MPKTRSDNLPSLQKRIILFLAENEPQTMNETSEKISKHYKPTWIAFKSLEKKKLIKKTTIKEHQGRKYPCYWLTDEGMIMALIEGSRVAKLLKEVKILYPDAKIIHCFLEIIPFFDLEVIRMAYSSIKGKGKLEPIEVATLILSGAAMPMEIETGKKIATILKKYPNQYEGLKRAIQLMIDQLSLLIAD